MADYEPGEELLETRTWPRWLLIVAALVAVLAILVGLKHAATPTHTSAPQPSPPDTFTALPDGPGPTGDLRSCPNPAVCSVLSTAPRALADALAAHLPGVMVRQVHSIEYVSASELRMVVWFREVRVRSGSSEVVVQIQQARAGDHDVERTYLIGSRRGVRLERVFFDRAVLIRLDGSGPVPTLAQLRSLAADVRLVAG